MLSLAEALSKNCRKSIESKLKDNTKYIKLWYTLYNKARVE